jgi:integrase
MARHRSGQLMKYVRKDGTTRFSARVTAYGNRELIVLGDERDGMTPLMAERELDRILNEIRLSTWEAPRRARSKEARRPEPLFAEAAPEFLEWKRASQLREGSMARLQWIFDVHLVPYFGRTRPSRIDEEMVTAYTEHQIARRATIRALREDGKYLEGPKGGAMRPMTNRTINDTLQVLTELLRWAAGKGWGVKGENPAAGWRLKEETTVVFPLEADELADLVRAVATPRPSRWQPKEIAERARTIVRLRDVEELPWEEIGRAVGLGVPTAIYHYQLAKDPSRVRVDRERAAADRPFISALAWAGPRVTELCELDVEEVDLRHAKFRIPDSKTPSGVREVDMTPRLVRIVTAYFESRPGMSGSEPAFPDWRGNRRNKNSVNQQVLRPAVRLANERRVAAGAGKLPRVSAHVLRHTYITLALEAGYPVPYVRNQVGHRHSRTTLEIYAKVLARKDRTVHGEAFDRLVGEDGEEGLDDY